MRRVLILVFLAACSKKEEPSPERIASAAPAPIASTPKSFTASQATFQEDVLMMCVDLTSTDRATAEAFASADSGTALSKTCGEQFPDRKPLASCTVTRKKDGALVKASFYTFEAVGEDDIEMQECIKSGGDWKAVERNSVEWRRAQREHAGRNLHKAAGRAEEGAETFR